MSTPSNPMTTENGVRVPDGWRVMAFTGSFAARGERWEIYDPDGNGGGVCAGDVTDESVANLLDALTGLAAPAPAGSLPEQEAGLQTLADEWAHAIRNGVMDDGEGDGPMFYATEEWALNMLESIRALARQQSRVVDEVSELRKVAKRNLRMMIESGIHDPELALKCLEELS